MFPLQAVLVPGLVRLILVHLDQQFLGSLLAVAIRPHLGVFPVAVRDDAVGDQPVGVFVHQGELQERRLGHQFFGFRLVGLGQAGQLDHDFIVAHRPDFRLCHADGVHPPAQHLHGLGEGALLLQRVGGVQLHFHEERRAALQVEAKLNLPGHLFLERLQYIAIAGYLAAKLQLGSPGVIAQHQAGVVHCLLQNAKLVAVFVIGVMGRLGLIICLFECRVLVRGLPELLDQFSGLVLERPHFSSRPGENENQE